MYYNTCAATMYCNTHAATMYCNTHAATMYYNTCAATMYCNTYAATVYYNTHAARALCIAIRTRNINAIHMQQISKALCEHTKQTSRASCTAIWVCVCEAHRETHTVGVSKCRALFSCRNTCIKSAMYMMYVLLYGSVCVRRTQRRIQRYRMSTLLITHYIHQEHYAVWVSL